MPLSDTQLGSGIAKWAAQAQPGAAFSYWVNPAGEALACDNPAAQAVLEDARHLYDLGYIELVQQRRLNGDLDYVAVKRRQRAWGRYDEWKRRAEAERLGLRPANQWHARRG